MSLQQVLRTQWDGYQCTHATRANFVVHLTTVPVFMAGTLGFICGAVTLSMGYCVLGLFAMAVAMAAQAWGHKHEAHSPAPFTSRSNAFARIFLEQWVTFPKYALHAAWRTLSRR
ncbi:terminase [Pusillimonas sp. MFBS29]|uniref:terminase n=1 Tax=Pusillimonas sp. MFBS29 TaxID=2886690 RepID=UPI001D10E4A0|nr:terminase [Pusillimonas sp. MFBS29]MCC2595098.1 terminase [Pusillimonas sp. MFBS29]